MTDRPIGEPVDELLATIKQLPHGTARLDVLHQAAQMADTHRDVATAFRVRRQLIDESAWCTRYDLYAVAFTWCLATARKHPTRFSVSDLLTHYQRVIGRMVNFPNVSRAQYDSLFADVVREFRSHGWSLRIAQLERRAVAVDFGDRAMAEDADREWRKEPPVELEPGDAEREIAKHLDHELYWGTDEAAVRYVDQYFAVPQRKSGFDLWVSGLSLMPLHRVGRAEDAAARFRSAAAARTTGFIWSRGWHLEYAGEVGEFDQGLREFEKQLPAALALPDPLSQFYCLRPAMRLFDRMAAAGVKTVSMRAPENVPWGEGRGKYGVPEILDWLRTQATDIAEQFDARNGNGFYADWIRRTFAGIPRPAA